MKQITQFPRIPLAVLPTPLYKLEAISREYGKNIYIKRDDMFMNLFINQLKKKIGK